MNDHEHCVNKTDGKSWCGKDTRGQWAFVDIKHAKDTASFGSRMTVCANCIKAFESTIPEGDS